MSHMLLKGLLSVGFALALTTAAAQANCAVGTTKVRDLAEHICNVDPPKFKVYMHNKSGRDTGNISEWLEMGAIKGKACLDLKRNKPVTLTCRRSNPEKYDIEQH